MRPVRYSVAASLDGYIAGPQGEFDWIPEDPTVDFAALFAKVDTVLLGRRSYELVRQQGGGPAWEPGTRVYVFSRTLRPEEHPDVTIVSAGAGQIVAGLRAEPGDGEIWLFGGGDLFRSLLAEGQVDSVEITIVPVLVGGGVPLLQPGAPRTALTLTGTRTYPSGMVTLSYTVPGAPEREDVVPSAGVAPFPRRPSMRSIRLRLLPVLLAMLLTVIAAPAHAASELGQIDFPTSGSAPAQALFVRGVAALHSFFYDEAADLFREAQKADPGFALAYWGEAMTYNHPIWAEQDRDAALAALARLAPTPAQRAAKAPTEGEKAWLAAVEILYGEGEKPVRDAAYAEAMRKLHERYPDDVEAASFYTLSLIGPALIGPPGDARDRPLIRAAAILEELFARAPRHPGVLHYSIHAYDDPLHAPLGLRAARLYARTAPAAHHALHMPSHIFVQIGDWPSAAASNEDSWAASVDWVKRRGHPVDKQDFHSLSWLLYAYVQQGRLGKARETLETVRAAGRASDSVRVTSSVKEMEARYLVETRSWRKDLIPAKASATGAAPCHGAGTPSPGRGDGALLYAAGLGAARSADPGDLEVAEQAAAKLREIAKKGDAPYRGEASAAILADQISGLVALRKGNAEEALKLLAAAAEAESRLSPPSGPPDPSKPSHELYGEALLELGRAEEAGKQFELALLRTPNRPASLLGAARVAAKRGDRDAARRYYGQLAEIWRQADAGHPELAEAKSYLEDVRTAP